MLQVHCRSPMLSIRDTAAPRAEEGVSVERAAELVLARILFLDHRAPVQRLRTDQTELPGSNSAASVHSKLRIVSELLNCRVQHRSCEPSGEAEAKSSPNQRRPEFWLLRSI
jgi:hypothetical protein